MSVPTTHHPKATAPESDAPSTATGKVRILVVDDEPSMREMLRIALREVMRERGVPPGCCFECGADLTATEGENCPQCHAPLAMAHCPACGQPLGKPQ